MTKSRTNKSTIKNDPFATVIPLADGPKPPELTMREPLEDRPVTVSMEQAAPANRDRTRRPSVVAEVAVPKAGRQKLTVHLESSLADRVKNAAYWNPRLTIAGIAEQGIRSAIEKCERENGGKYPPREGELVGGRPIK